MAEKRNRPDEDTSEREIIIRRVFDAPREVIWNAWTDPKQIVEWWGPRGFTTTIEEMDVRPGGEWRLTMHGPDGSDYPNRSRFIDVVKPERISYSHGGGKKGEPGAQFEGTWTFEAQGNKTLVTLRMVFPTAAARDLIVKTHNAIEGGNQTFDRLGERLAGLSAIGRTLVITHIFDAPRELVFAAWTEPKHLAQWFGPNGFTNPVCEVDLRPGGNWRHVMRGPNGAEYPLTAIFQEIVRPERLVFKTYVPEMENSLFEILNIAVFAEQGAKTKLTLQLKVLKSSPEAAPMLAGMEVGWKQSLDRLSRHVASN